MKKCNICGIEKQESEFRVRSSGGPVAYCKPCHREYDKLDYKRHKGKRVYKKRLRNSTRRTDTREFIYQYLSKHPCVDCGEKDILVLDFDHLRNKSNEVSTMALSQCSIKTITKEIEKCVVRCSNCHRRKTHQEFDTWKYKKIKNS